VIGKNSEIERMAIFLLRCEGWTISPVRNSTGNYRLELFKPNQKIAALIQNQHHPLTIGQIENFLSFLLQSNSHDFTGGMIISTSGFTPSVYAYLRKENIRNVSLAILKDNKLLWNCESLDVQREKTKPDYFGIFTCKGGVGKTTIAAHLSGAFAMNGYDVGLIDMDKQRNLQKLLGERVYTVLEDGENPSVIEITTPHGWSENKFLNTKIVICDCNPDFESNQIDLIRRFDYCLIPTTLNPLGVNKNADVIKRTFEKIRRENENAKLFVIINNYYKEETRRNQLLNQLLKSQFKQITEMDRNCHYIDPEDVAIRFSKQLLYWGFHIVEQTKPTLAFRSIGGYSNPRMDFLKLVDYLENQTGIEKLEKTRVAKLLGI
jgi:chromosome partitioning protein